MFWHKKKTYYVIYTLNYGVFRYNATIEARNLKEVYEVLKEKHGLYDIEILSWEIVNESKK